MKFIVSGANVKYNQTWKDEWVVVKGDWGHSLHIGGTEHSVSNQFTMKDKWGKRVISMESLSILQRIHKREYTNLNYPSNDSFEGDRLDQYLRISVAHPGMLFSSFLSLSVL